MYYFIEIACVVAEVWLIHLLLSSMLVRKRQSPWVCTVLYVFVGAILAAISFVEDAAFIRIATSLLLVWLISATVFDANIIRSFLCAVVMCMLVALADVLTSLLFARIDFDSTVIMERGSERSLYLISAHILMFGMVMCVCGLNHRQGNNIPLKLLAPVAPCWIVSLLLCVTLAWDYVVKGHDTSTIYLIVLLGLLYTNIVVIYYINQLAKQEQEKLNQQLAEHHYLMQQDYYDQFHVQQEETRALWHDISKLLRAVQAENTGKALAQAEQMLCSITGVVDVDNRVVSVILNEYAQIAKDVSIRLALDIHVPKELFVTAVDLYVLIGNTMDNAIEACTPLSIEQREITLKLKLHNGILFFEIENPFDPSHLNRVRGKMHGYGLLNVQRCVEKYNGNLDIQQKNGIFRLSAHLNNN